MKTAHDPRHLHRIALVKSLYTYAVAGTVAEEMKPVIDDLTRIDEQIAEAAPKHALGQMNKVDLALLRAGVFELLRGEKAAIVIDEFVEIAKEYGADESPDFIHATLHTIGTHL